MLLLLVLLVAVALAAAALAARLRGRSLVVVVSGDRRAWVPFLAGARSVSPGAQLVLLPDADLEYTAYCDALDACVARFGQVICQVPCQRAADTLARAGGRAVAVGSPPELTGGSVMANIVVSEQAYANLLTGLAAAPAGGRRALLSSVPVRAPAGWTQLRVEDGGGVQAALAGVSSLRFEVVVVTVPVGRAACAAVAAANPGAQVLVVSEGSAPLPDATVQVAEDAHGKGRLAAAMLRGGYAGPRDVVVDPRLVKPAQAPPAARVTLLSQLLLRPGGSFCGRQ